MRASGSWGAIAVSLAVVALLNVPPGLADSLSPRGVAALPQLSATSDLLPSALLAPWASRVGFNATLDAQVQNSTAAAGLVIVALTLAPRDPTFFAPPEPGSAPLSSAGIASRFAISSNQYAALEQYLTGQGLTILHSWPDRMSLTVAGPAATVGSAFGTALRAGTWHGRSVQFSTSVPELPSPYAGEVSAISGLNTGFSAFAIPFSSVPAAPQPSQGRTTRYITPVALHVAYDLDGLYNSSGTARYASNVGIALLLWGEGYSPSDLQTFYGTYYPSEFPAVRLAPYPVDGAPNPSSNATSDPSGATQELTLDLEWAGSEAPGATLDAVYAPDGPASNGYSPADAAMEDAVNTAVQSISGVQVLSMSFGTQDGTDTSFQAAFSTAFATAAQRGITVLAASGDNSGYARAGCAGNIDPQFPAASPQVVAVGGTDPTLSLDPLGTVTGIESEPAWNGSGGGFSNQYAPASWQEQGSAAGPVKAADARGIPDVAGPSADNFFFFNGASAAGKGTSFATPMWAGMIAEMDAIRGRPFGFLTPRLYSIGAGEEKHVTATGLVDITGGSTCLGPAGPGWDTATGWGSPRAYLLYEDLVATFVTEALSTSAPNVAPGGSFDADVHVANLTNGAPLVGVVVGFTLSSDGQVGLCTGTFQTASATTDARGNASVSLGVPGCYFGSKVVLSATITSSGYFATNSTTLEVNLLGFAGFLAVIQDFPYNVLAFGLIILVSVLLAWRIGEWRHRRDQAATARRRGAVAPGPPPPTGAVMASSAATVAAPAVGGPPPPPPPPPRAPVPDSGRSSTGPAPATFPDGTTAGGASAPSAPSESGTTPPRCPSCGAAVAYVARSCPNCGAALG
jgi:kumamolisin